jgi:diguanylate cyclase (GGDEF)-like protein
MKVLVAEDEIISRTVIEAILTESGYEVVLASNGKEAWDVLQSHDAPKLAILDWMMPEMDGIEICRAVRQKNIEPYVYIILLTAKNNIADIVKGLESGADDYILKPFNADELKVRLRAGQRIVNLQAELIAAREKLRELAVRDILTGAWNRYAIWEMLKLEIYKSWRTGDALSILMCDIDHFKLINDRYGHLIGDIVLKEVVKRLKGCLRTYSGVGRYGGEEFLVILQGCEMSVAMQIAERARLAINSLVVDTPKGRVSVTMSFGVASIVHGDETSANSLVNAADEALYRAKQMGRNRVEGATIPRTRC